MNPSLDSLPTGWYRGTDCSFLSLSADDPLLKGRPFPDFFVEALLEEPAQEDRIILVTSKTGRVLGSVGFTPGVGMNAGMLEVHGVRLVPREPGEHAMRGLRDAVYWFGSLPHVRGSYAEVPDDRLEAACILYGLGYRGEWRKGPLGEGRIRLAAPAFDHAAPAQSPTELQVIWPDHPAPKPTHETSELDRRVHEEDVDPLMQCAAARMWLGIPDGAEKGAVLEHLSNSEDLEFAACGPLSRRSWLLVSREIDDRRETWLHTEGPRTSRHAPHLRALRHALLQPPNHAWILHQRSDSGGTAALLAGLTPMGPAPVSDSSGAELWSLAL